MGYIEQTMLPGEQVLAMTRLHWAIFLVPLPFIIIGMVISLPSLNADQKPALIVSVLLGGIFIELLIYVVYRTTELAVTNRRLIVKHGFLSRRSVELLLEKIESFYFDQSSFGRLLNFGTITVTGIGATKARYSFILAPLFFYKKVHEVLMFHSQTGRHH